MTRSARSSVLAALLIVSLAAPSIGQQYYIYSPKAVASGEQSRPGEGGVLVREVEVEKGDTLFGISRRFSGRGSYYPQILLFNELKNPNLIHPGNTLKIPVTSAGSADAAAVTDRPVSRKQEQRQPAKPVSAPAAAPAKPALLPSAAKAAADPLTEISLSELKRYDSGSKKHTARKRKSIGKEEKRAVRQPVKTAAREGTAPSAQSQETASASTPRSQGLYERAVKAFRQEDFRTAVDLFDRFLSENPNSPLASDASLYKAESYLKMSGQ